MMSPLKTTLRRIWRREDGTSSVEFVMVFPIFLFSLFWSIETCVWMLRATSLERGLDMAIREIRISTQNSQPTYDDLKKIICDTSGMLGSECFSDLKLELQKTDPRAFNGLPAEADCRDKSEPIKPAVNFNPGQPNDLMLVRACARIEPIFPALHIGNAMKRETDGGTALVAISTFVQEP